jgi:hypothetical protein
MDRGLPESVLGPVRRSVLEVQGVEVYNQILHSCSTDMLLNAWHIDRVQYT